MSTLKIGDSLEALVDAPAGAVGVKTGDIIEISYFDNNGMFYYFHNFFLYGASMHSVGTMFRVLTPNPPVLPVVKPTLTFASWPPHHHDFLQGDFSCDHEFISYIGLRESFEYCKKCDQKKA